MRITTNRIAVLGSLTVTALAAIACNNPPHRMAQTEMGAHTVCRECYDEAVQVSVGATGAQRNQVIKRHACASCRTEMEVYVEDGVRKMKCARCAPEGVACDKCRPADIATK